MYYYLTQQVELDCGVYTDAYLLELHDDDNKKKYQLCHCVLLKTPCHVLVTVVIHWECTCNILTQCFHIVRKSTTPAPSPISLSCTH